MSSIHSNVRIQKRGLAEELDLDRGRLDLRLCLLPPGAPSLLSASWSSGCWLPDNSDPVTPRRLLQTWPSFARAV